MLKNYKKNNNLNLYKKKHVLLVNYYLTYELQSYLIFNINCKFE